MTQTQKHVPHPLDYVQREVRNGVECRVLTEKQYQTLHQKQAELLAALKEARSFLSVSLADDGRYDPCAETLKTVNSAIAKAEGR